MTTEATPTPEPTTREKINAACAELGLKLSAAFVPWSQSRHAVDKPKLSDLNLNWRVTITREQAGYRGEKFTTDYMQGIGHIPGYPSHELQRLSVDGFASIRNACETGRYDGCGGGFRIGSKPLPLPQLADVLSCLLTNASALDARNFEDWADDYGYDSDSRKAEAIYNACLKTGLELRRLLGDRNMQQLRELAVEL